MTNPALSLSGQRIGGVIREWTKGEAERLATRLEAEEKARHGDFRYILVDRDLLLNTIKFLREIEGNYRAALTAGERGKPCA